MKTFLKILTPLALALPLLAKDATNAPASPATPAAAPAAPAATPPTRALPRPITPPPAAPGGAAAGAVPAPGAPAAPAQQTIPAPQPPANPNAARPAAPAAPGANQATPVVPGITPPGGAGAARPGVAGAPAAGAPGAAGAAGANQPAGAAAKNPADEIFPAGLIKFQDADLSQVLEIYQELTGRTILKPASLPQVKISIRTQTELTRAEAIQALDSILSLNGITMVPQGDPVKGKFIKALAEPQAGTAGAQINDLPHELLPESGTYVTHVVQLTNASPNDIIQVLQPFAKAPNSILTIPSTGMLVLRDYAENVKRMLEMVAKVDVVPQQEFESVVIPIKYALAGDIATVLGNLTAGGGSATTIGGQGQGGGGGLRGGVGGFGSRGGLGGVGGVGGVGGIPGQPGYNPNALNNQGLGGVGGVGGAGGRSSFQNRLQQIVNRAATGNSSGDIFVLGQTKVIADERINALLIFASKADLHTISNIIEKLDVVLSQVLIEAIVMEVSLGNDLNYGFSYLQRQPGSKIGDVANGIGGLKNVPFLNSDNFGSLATNAAGALPSGFSYFASFMDFDATAVAAASDSRINVISRPRIQTSHAVEAQLFVGNTRPYVSGQYSYFGGGPQTQFQQQQIGISLSVLPLINAEGLVVMDISTKIQQIGEEIAIDANFKVPETIDREATAKVAVRDRETIMLGGFISSSKSKSKSGIPILKDIPVLGNLFSSVKDSDQRKELILLIRPTVLPTPQDAATFASEERSRLPGTRRADKEFIESEKKLLDQENRRSAKDARKLYKKEGFSN